uniref:Histidine phosphatase family protein n=1 Tax=Rhabditophanes sp. KR3021 TaxID=114890 RepID=A0AC35TSF9_9BILA
MGRYSNGFVQKMPLDETEDTQSDSCSCSDPNLPVSCHGSCANTPQVKSKEPELDDSRLITLRPSVESFRQETRENVVRTLTKAIKKRLICMRHGERLDYIFPKWFKKMVTEEVYGMTDLNQPYTLSTYRRRLCDFKDDPSLTNSGCVVSQIIGSSLKLSKYVPDVIYCSPALRCIQTASHIVSGSNSKAPIRIEPGLFQENYYTDLENPSKSPFMTMNQLRHSPIKAVDTTYRPIVDIKQLLKNKDTNLTYNARIQFVFDKIIKNSDQNVLILMIAHASTVDMCAGYFSFPRRQISQHESDGIANYIPYNGSVAFEINDDGDFVKNKKIIQPMKMHACTTVCDEPFITRDCCKQYNYCVE